MHNSKSQLQVLVIHGPNLNMLGEREPQIYGIKKLEDINAEMTASGKKLGVLVETFQSNHEGAIVEKIQTAMGSFDGLIINPAAYTHTSIAIRDALLLLDIPIIEVHLSNIYQRESFRRESMTAAVCTAQITGFGPRGYIIAIEAITEMVTRRG